MPKQTGTSLLASMVPQLRAAHKEIKGTEAKVDTGGRLPAGIQAGVAQLVDCRIAKVKEGSANAGKLQFIAAGIVKEPHDHGGVPVRGLRTSVIEPLYDTPDRQAKTFADHYKAVANIVTNLLGRKEIDDDTAPENIEATMAALVQAKPHFRFRTWVGSKQVIDQRKDGKWTLYDEDESGKKTPSRRITGAWATKDAAEKANPYAGRDPRVNEVWGSLVEYVDASSNGQMVDDGTAAQDEEEAADVGVDEETTEAADEAAAEVDLEALVAAAAAGGDDGAEAEKELVRIAEEAGIEDADSKIESANKWEDVLAMIQEAQAGAAEEESAEEEEVEEEVEEQEEEKPAIPAKGDSVKYTIQVTVKNSKTGKKSKKDKKIDAEVVTVNTKSKTVTLKNLGDGKTLYKDVPWDKVEA